MTRWPLLENSCRDPPVSLPANFCRYRCSADRRDGGAIDGLEAASVLMELSVGGCEGLAKGMSDWLTKWRSVFFDSGMVFEEA